MAKRAAASTDLRKFPAEYHAWLKDSKNYTTAQSWLKSSGTVLEVTARNFSTDSEAYRFLQWVIGNKRPRGGRKPTIQTIKERIELVNKILEADIGASVRYKGRNGDGKAVLSGIQFLVQVRTEDGKEMTLSINSIVDVK